MNTKATSLRLPKGMADELAAIARADGNSVSEAVREALEDYITTRRSDQAFKERLRQRMEEDRELLERMGG
ncbi:MAG: ribbon-helix-helix protein, CopG family [Solirubrobacterales bacterium]